MKICTKIRRKKHILLKSHIIWNLREKINIKDIPEGFSIFCTLWEAGKVKQYMRLSKEEQDRLGVGEKEKLDKNNDVLEEPVPMGTKI